MENCIFCKIVAGKMPSYKVFENDMFFGFLDIFPRSRGHTLIIPKKHYRWTYEVPNFAGYWQTALDVTHAIQKSLNPTWIGYFTYGAVPHAHIHIVPRFDEIDISPDDRDIIPHTKIFTKEEMEAIAKQIAGGF